MGIARAGHLPMEAAKEKHLLMEASQKEPPMEAAQKEPLMEAAQREPPMEAARRNRLFMAKTRRKAVLIRALPKKGQLMAVPKMRMPGRAWSSFTIPASGVLLRAKRGKKLPGGRGARRRQRRKSPMALGCLWQNAQQLPSYSALSPLLFSMGRGWGLNIPLASLALVSVPQQIITQVGLRITAAACLLPA